MPMSPETSRHVLVVDDAPVMLRILRTILNTLGYTNVDTVLSVPAAMSALQRQSYDLVICDYHLGELNGYDLFRSMRSHPAMSRIPFLLTTTQAVESAMSDEARMLLRQSALKPFSAATLQAKIADTCAAFANAA